VKWRYRCKNLGASVLVMRSTGTATSRIDEGPERQLESFEVPFSIKSLRQDWEEFRAMEVPQGEKGRHRCRIIELETRAS
jgi:hypothetical protein